MSFKQLRIDQAVNTSQRYWEKVTSRTPQGQWLHSHLLHEIYPPLNEGPGQEEGNRTLQTGYSIVQIWTLLKYRHPPTVGQCHPSYHPSSPSGRIAISLYQPPSSFLRSLEKDPALLPITMRSPLLCAFQPPEHIGEGQLNSTMCIFYLLRA